LKVIHVGVGEGIIGMHYRTEVDQGKEEDTSFPDVDGLRIYGIDVAANDFRRPLRLRGEGT
jgi:hypothetical protein